MYEAILQDPAKQFIRQLPKDKQELVFEPFVRLQDKIVEVDGVGIGLTVAKSFVEIMQGKIIVESEPGAGSCFSVEFPSVLAGY